MKGCAVFLSPEVALRHSPVSNCFGDAGDQLANAGFALRRADFTMQILRRDNICRGHRPVFGDFDIFLLENDSALRVGDLRETLFPFNFVVRRDSRLSEESADAEAGGFVGLRRGGDGCSGCGLSLDFGHFFLS